MANIMITERCNLRCPYCFANEYTFEKNGTDIKEKQLREILEFILQDGSENRVGLIGGEPLYHPRFDEILNIIKSDKRIEHITIYTNGVFIDKYIEQLKDGRIHLLINCNDLQFDKALDNRWRRSLKLAAEELKGQIRFGCNFYKQEFDYNYILKLVEEYHCERLRVSISVPNTMQYNYDPLEYFEGIKPRIFQFFRELHDRNVIPYLDCNIFPSCLISASEIKEFDDWGANNPLSIIKNKETGCAPVIDIMPNMTAVRCFGLSEFTKESIRDFASLKDLKNYYLRRIDAFTLNCVYSTKCEKCYKYKTIKCAGGCLVYKIEKALKIRDLVDNYGK